MTDSILLALITIYIVDVSGFTQSWRSGLAHILGIKELRPLKPFDCGQCMTWWTGLALLLIQSRFTFLGVAGVALLAMLAEQIAGIMFLIRDAVTYIITTISNKIL